MRLLETMRADDGRIALLNRHLARLAVSAAALGYTMDAETIRERVEEAEIGGGAWGVRLTLGKEGDTEIQTWSLPYEPMRTVWIDPEPFGEAGSVRCVHKTTDRDHYRQRYDRAFALGADEAILLNARGEVVEGTRTTVWAEIGGRWLTPPLASGGLAGVMRAHLLDTRPGHAVAPLTADDLRQSSGLALSNALRGWMPVRLLNPGGASGYAPLPLSRPTIR